MPIWRDPDLAVSVVRARCDGLRPDLRSGDARSRGDPSIVGRGECAVAARGLATRPSTSGTVGGRGLGRHLL